MHHAQQKGGVRVVRRGGGQIFVSLFIAFVRVQSRPLLRGFGIIARRFRQIPPAARRQHPSGESGAQNGKADRRNLFPLQKKDFGVVQARAHETLEKKAVNAQIPFQTVDFHIAFIYKKISFYHRSNRLFCKASTCHARHKRYHRAFRHPRSL